MKRLRERPPVVRMEWRRWWPTRPYPFWVRVARVVRERRIKHIDVVAVREVCGQIESERRWT